MTAQFIGQNVELRKRGWNLAVEKSRKLQALMYTEIGYRSTRKARIRYKRRENTIS